MAKSIEEIRNELKAAQEKANGGGNFKSKFGPSDVFPFWNVPDNTTATLRFLPSDDPNSPYFWRERQIINIPFKTVEGHPELTDVTVSVPCVKMYNKKNVCPIINDTRPLWNGSPADVEIARQYWPKKSFLFQGFVVDSELSETETPENPIRRFIINKTIHKLIESALLDPDMDANPSDEEHGYDFKVVKSKQGGSYADYSTSGFARRPRPLSQEERDAIQEYGLFDLNDFLPREPDSTMLDTIVAMYEESRKPDSEYKLEWSTFYTPKGVQLNTANVAPTPQSSTPQSAPDVKDDGSSQSAPEVNDDGTTQASDDIMAQIRARMQ